MNRPFWAGAAGNAVVIEADAFKESDVIYRALSKRGHSDMVHTAELVSIDFPVSSHIQSTMSFTLAHQNSINHMIPFTLSHSAA